MYNVLDITNAKVVMFEQVFMYKAVLMLLSAKECTRIQEPAENLPLYSAIRSWEVRESEPRRLMNLTDYRRNPETTLVCWYSKTWL
jgi:hypothetical protein